MDAPYPTEPPLDDLVRLRLKRHLGKNILGQSLITNYGFSRKLYSSEPQGLTAHYTPAPVVTSIEKDISDNLYVNHDTAQKLLLSLEAKKFTQQLLADLK